MIKAYALCVEDWHKNESIYFTLGQRLKLPTILSLDKNIFFTAASWSSGRVQDSGLGSRSSPEFNTLPVRLLIVPLSKALHAALLLSTQEQSGYLWGQICKPWCQVACERLYAPQGVEMDIQMDMECEGPMTREGTCQSLQSRALSLDVDSKQWLYFTLPLHFATVLNKLFQKLWRL